MKLWVAPFAVIAAAIAASAQAAPKLKPYQGPDSGRLILSIAASRTPEMAWRLLCFHKVGEPGVGTVSFVPVGFFRDHIQFTEPAPGAGRTQTILKSRFGLSYSAMPVAGDVKIFSLEPGDYEIDSVQQSGNDDCRAGQGEVGRDVSIPFKVRPGRSVYLGEFKFLGVHGKFDQFDETTLSDYRIVLSDQGARDLPVARSRDPGLGDVDAAVPDADALGSFLFGSAP